MQTKNSPPIRCPKCGGALIRMTSNTLKCTVCSATYPVK